MTVGILVDINRGLANGVDMRAGVALKRVVLQIPQMDVMVHLADLVCTNVL